MKMCFLRGFQRMLIAAQGNVKLAFLDGNFFEGVIFAVPVNPDERSHLVFGEFWSAGLDGFFGGSGFRKLEVVCEKNVGNLVDEPIRIDLRRIAKHRCRKMLIREAR